MVLQSIDQQGDHRARSTYLAVCLIGLVLFSGEVCPYRHVIFHASAVVIKLFRFNERAHEGEQRGNGEIERSGRTKKGLGGAFYAHDLFRLASGNVASTAIGRSTQARDATTGVIRIRRSASKSHLKHGQMTQIGHCTTGHKSYASSSVQSESPRSKGRMIPFRELTRTSGENSQYAMRKRTPHEEKKGTRRHRASYIVDALQVTPENVESHLHLIVVLVGPLVLGYKVIEQLLSFIVR